MPLMYPLVFAAFLFSAGVYSVLARRNAVMVLMSIELMLNAVNVNLIAFNAYLRDQLNSGQVFALFVIAVAAAGGGIGLAIALLIFANRETVTPEEVALLRWGHDRSVRGEAGLARPRPAPGGLGGPPAGGQAPPRRGGGGRGPRRGPRRGAHAWPPPAG